MFINYEKLLKINERCSLVSEMFKFVRKEGKKGGLGGKVETEEKENYHSINNTEFSRNQGHEDMGHWLFL